MKLLQRLRFFCFSMILFFFLVWLFAFLWMLLTLWCINFICSLPLFILGLFFLTPNWGKSITYLRVTSSNRFVFLLVFKSLLVYLFIISFLLLSVSIIELLFLLLLLLALSNCIGVFIFLWLILFSNFIVIFCIDFFIFCPLRLLILWFSDYLLIWVLKISLRLIFCFVLLIFLLLLSLWCSWLVFKLSWRLWFCYLLV